VKEQQPSNKSSVEAARRVRSARGGVRLSPRQRQRGKREAARRLVATRTKQPLTVEQRAFDPLLRGKRSAGQKLAYVAAAVIGSVVVHLLALGIGLIAPGGKSNDDRNEDVKIEVKPPPEPPPPPEKKPEPEPPKAIEKKPEPPPKAVKAPPPPATPAPPTKAPPVRVVGLSLESTTEGGEGPSFAVGNTRVGETAEKAVAPKSVTAAPSGTSTIPAAGPGRSNQVASRIPVAGIAWEKPKRKAPKNPPYPATLRSQGIEGDVVVLVNIDATGKVTTVKIIKESTSPEFNEAARATALAEEWEPALRDGVPAPYTLSYTYRFRLNDE
jgi:protein TonB